ncbi:MAG: flagellar motor protein MotB, partial [Proteobacteria bacterium]|nr:flagellar motor protein MotB [Pseudomonadota bacterium]
GGGAHGGAWKIAYADFVTAMMAFFLLMWLLGSTSQGDLKGIADFFNTPLKVALEGGSGSGDTSTTLLQGGGEDLTRSNGQVRKGERMETKESVKVSPMQNEITEAKEKQEAQKLNELKQLIESKIENNPSLRQFKNQLLLDITAEGLRIQIVDEKNRPMFDSASADLKPYTRIILREIGNALNGVVNRVSMSGHTDATPFAGGNQGIGNWELSASRANASRRELIAGGMQEDKTLRVVGLASAVPWDKQDPYSAINRRISIIVMNKKTEDTILRDGKDAEGELPPALSPPTAPGSAPAPVAAPALEAKPAGH